MKRFRWPLQRLLDVTAQRERALRGELLELSRRMVLIRQDIARRAALLRMLLAELAQQPLEVRLARQETFMRSSATSERQIAGLKEKLKELESLRKAKMQDFMRARSRRQTLQRLQEEARQRHLREQLALEQKQFDEGAHVSFARKAMSASGRQ